MKQTHLFILFFFLLAINTSSLQAQDSPIFEIVGIDSESITNEDKATIEKLINTKEQLRISNGWATKVIGFETKKDLNLDLRLPGVSSLLKLKSEHIHEFTNSLFGKVSYTIWGGKLYGPRKQGSFFILKGDNGYIGGVFHFDNQVFELLSVSRQNGILRKTNLAFSKNHACGLENQAREEGGIITSPSNNNVNSITYDACGAPPSGCLNIWKILNAYPQSELDLILANSNGNTFLASLFIAIVKATFTTTLQNSGISAQRLTLIDANIGSYTAPTTNAALALASFNLYASTNLKPIYNYDKVILMTHQDYGAISGIADCVSYTDAMGYNSDCDAAIVRSPTIWAPEWTYAHELGHLFGAQHDPSSNNGVGFCSQGIIFTLGGEDRTVMATLHAGNSNATSTGILYFSENGETYNGFNIGSPTQNNKVVIQNVICQSITSTFSAPATSRNSLKDTNPFKELLYYPNPVTDFISIEIGDNIKQIEIISSDGKTVKFLNHNQLYISNRIDVSEFSSGMYYLKVSTKNTIQTVKFIKQ